MRPNRFKNPREQEKCFDLGPHPHWFTMNKPQRFGRGASCETTSCGKALPGPGMGYD